MKVHNYLFGLRINIHILLFWGFWVCLIFDHHELSQQLKLDYKRGGMHCVPAICSSKKLSKKVFR